MFISYWDTDFAVENGSVDHDRTGLENALDYH